MGVESFLFLSLVLLQILYLALTEIPNIAGFLAPNAIDRPGIQILHLLVDFVNLLVQEFELVILLGSQHCVELPVQLVSFCS